MTNNLIQKPKLCTTATVYQMLGLTHAATLPSPVSDIDVFDRTYHQADSFSKQFSAEDRDARDNDSSSESQTNLELKMPENHLEHDLENELHAHFNHLFSKQNDLLTRLELGTTASPEALLLDMNVLKSRLSHLKTATAAKPQLAKSEKIQDHLRKGEYLQTNIMRSLEDRFGKVATASPVKADHYQPDNIPTHPIPTPRPGR